MECRLLNGWKDLDYLLQVTSQHKSRLRNWQLQLQAYKISANATGFEANSSGPSVAISDSSIGIINSVCNRGTAAGAGDADATMISP